MKKLVTLLIAALLLMSMLTIGAAASEDTGSTVLPQGVTVAVFEGKGSVICDNSGGSGGTGRYR